MKLTRLFSKLALSLLVAANGVWAQTDFWQQTNGPSGGVVQAFAINNAGDLFAGTRDGGVFHSANNGANWSAVNSGLTNKDIQALAINNAGEVFAGTFSGVFRSSNNGANWSQINSGLTSTAVHALAINSAGHIFAGAFGGGVFRSTDNGDTWSQVNTGLPLFPSVNALAINSNEVLIAGINSDGIFRSTDNGDNWSSTSLGSGTIISLTTMSAGEILAGSSTTQIYRSADDGATWSTLFASGGFQITSLAVNSQGDIFAFTSGGGGGILRSTDHGANWSPAANGLTTANGGVLIVDDNDGLFAGDGAGGVFRSTDNGDNWSEINNGLHNGFVSALAVSQSYLFAGGVGAFRSADNGANWGSINNGLIYFNTVLHSALTLAINSQGDILAGTQYGGVLRSTDNGDSWSSISNGLPIFTTVRTLALNSAGHIFAGSLGSGVFRSIDNGASWSAINTGLTNTSVWSLSINNAGHLFAGTLGGAFRSTDNGDNWMPINTGLTDSYVWSFAINNDGKIFAGTSGGVFISTDNGDNWSNTSLPINWVRALIINEAGHVFAGTSNNGVFLSTDNGTSWSVTNTGLTNTKVMAFTLDDDGFLFAGTAGGGVFRSAASTVPPTVKPFVFLANKLTLKLTKQATPVPPSGNMHSNGALTIEKGNPSIYNSKLTAVGKIAIGKDNTINGDVTSATAINNLGTINGNATIGAVDHEPLPNKSYSVGGPNKTVPKNGTLTLGPGSYNIVTLNSFGKLKLSSGDYFFNQLKYPGTTAVIEIDLSSGDPVNVNVVGNLQLGKEVEIRLLPNGESDSKLVTFCTLQSTSVTVGKEAYFLGTLNAQNAKVTLAKNSQLRGAIGANEIVVERDCLFLHHDSPGSLSLLVGSNLSKSSAGEEELSSEQSSVSSYQLAQNYPNPFNPSTTIKYELPQQVDVKLEIFDMMGRHVRTLVNQTQQAGRYAITWDGRNEQGQQVASGTFIYQLRAVPSTSSGTGSEKGFVQTRRMALVR